MSDPLKRFLDTAEDNNVDEALLNAPAVKKTLHNLENYGKDLGDTAGKIIKRPPRKPNGPTPTYQESVFIKPKSESTLYNVTNREKEIPVTTKVSKVFKKTSYSVRGLSAAASYKNENEQYSVFAGEKVGIGWNKKEGSTDTNLKATFNVGNQKTNLEYTSRNPIHSYNISVFNQNGNNGITAGYSNSKGIASVFSVDKNSVSVNCSYNKNYDNCKVELSAYATTGDKYSKPFAGIAGRVTF